MSATDGTGGSDAGPRTASGPDIEPSPPGAPRARRGAMLSGAVVALGCVLFLGGFVWGAVLYRPYTVPTDSMSPNIGAGDRVLAQRIDGDQVRRGDVVVFEQADWGDLPMVKRVVGVGGDTVACCTDGALTVDGRPVAEPYLAPGTQASTNGISRTVVPEGRLFLLGDERLGSLDSTAHLQDAQGGSVSRDAVVARVDAVVWPMDGTLTRPTGFAALPGGISRPGPLTPLLTSVAVGAVLILGGAAYGPLARRSARRRPVVSRPAGAR
ncbi:signal peptidase I [Streptomyces sp. SID4919]|nr:signal peptidase I [Streptomyces sp. SID4919]SCK62635.1 signal peptidase I . Serine peptidase. MEROPS family S26A [Streptomyces sp. AmelKG-E11A]